ncbi:MAG: hypothetical protein M3463_21495, partial [Verrucomicrobiota bacterium]|nr:hypothetical protein [Verrucomicrobiota bacterium]
WPPQPSTASDYDAAGRIVLPVEYAAWLASPQNSLGNVVTCASSSPVLRIINPQPATVYFLDSDLPRDTQCIPLRAEAAGNVAWSCASLKCEATGPRWRAQLRAGRHVISARDAATGKTAETWIEVREL